jgi:cysteinylglycine-S-conjugate dipeptidase
MIVLISPEANLEEVRQYAEKHFSDFLDALKTLVRIPSISFEGFPKEPLSQSAEAVAALFRSVGLENIEILKTSGAHPYIYGDWCHAVGKPTLLLYAHHDVQPTGREEVWLSAPFEPVEREGRLYGRGAADDKAGILVHTSAIQSYLRTAKKIPVNLKFIVEGEEEIGSGHLASFLQQYREKLQADVILLTDTGNFDTGIPTITTSLRGLVVTEVEVKTARRPLHSGMWGGPVPDPALALSKMLASLIDDDGRITLPGLYDKVRPLTKLEAESLQKLGYTEAQLHSQATLLPSVKVIGGQASPLEKMARLPSLAVNAIQVSSRKLAANIINESAWCRLGIRTVPDMDSEAVLKLLEDTLRKRAPWGAEVIFSGQQTAGWWMTDPSGPAFEKASRALAAAFGRETVYMGSGGSIPFVGPFASVLQGAPALLIGIEDPYTNAHAENESLHLGDFKKSIQAAIRLYEIFGE